MEFSSVKGFRDFYPEDMVVRNLIADAWRRVSLRNGFVEYEGPMLEYLDLFRVKSGDEIVSQLFSLTDRGGRELAIRPEQTPTLARMVNARINALPRPIKWFSIPWVCRAENPQRGRGREFFQWNVDVIGSDAALADAECIFTLADLLAELGLAPSEAQVFLSSRSLITAALSAVGVETSRHAALLPILDKRDKVPAEAFEEMCAKEGLAAGQIASISAFQDAATLEEAAARLGPSDTVAAECAKLAEVMGILDRMGAGDYCRLDLHVVRGLAYYTGVVYEAFDTDRSLRALAGGGRYDNLLETLGGPTLGATGFGMGDIVLGILLAERGKLPSTAESCDCYVIDAAESLFDAALGVVAELRRAGLRTNLSYKRQNLGKQLKAAARSGAAVAVIVGEELTEAGEVTIKTLATGDQRRVRRADLVAELKR
ncbi:MAG: histidine--tRNA ligase [Planctomycetes bacterium]|nr:histidine--tRNA ligase [Planctomycetota bacterium]